jgi:Glycosyl transferase family 11
VIPIVIIKGGLGNQLFQWIYAHSLQEKVTFYPSRFHYGHHDKIMHFELEDLFQTCHHVLNAGAKSPSREYLSRAAEWLWSKGITRGVAQSFLRYQQEDPRDDQAQNVSKYLNTWINSGYFQKNCYSEKSKGVVEREILPYVERVASKLLLTELIPRSYSVLHIRTGAYSSHNASDPNFIGNLDEKYFLNNVDKLKAKFLVVLTENADHIPKLLKKIEPDLVLDAKQLDAWETLATMAFSESMIGANSSLSWWGAKLASLKGAETWLPANWSVWNNIDTKAYRFPNLKVLESSWHPTQNS